MSLRLLLGILLALFARQAWATTYYQSGLEQVPCDHEINDENVDGRLWDTGQNSAGGAAFPFPFVRCGSPTPQGLKHLEVRSICLDGYTVDGRCDTASIPEAQREAHNSTSAFIDILIPSHAIVEGRTYFLGALIKYSRVAGRDLWLDTGTPNVWDKTLEFRGSAFRWGLGVGAVNSDYVMQDHRFTFDLWCADTAFTGCQTPMNADHKVQNASGYSGANPYFGDYDKWYAVVIKVTASTSTAGVAELFVNGTSIIQKTSQVTFNNGGTITDIEMYGTLGQTEYQRPESLMLMDNIVMADTLAEMQAAGLMSDPEAGLPVDTTAPDAPSGLMVQ